MAFLLRRTGVWSRDLFFCLRSIIAVAGTPSCHKDSVRNGFLTAHRPAGWVVPVADRCSVTRFIFFMLCRDFVETTGDFDLPRIGNGFVWSYFHFSPIIFLIHRFHTYIKGVKKQH